MQQSKQVSALSLLLGLTLATPAAAQAAQNYDFKAARQYSRLHNGHALLVQVDDKLVYEAYDNGWSASKAHRLASGTKSFNAFIVMKAVEEGLLKLDEKLADVLTEWKSDRRKSQISYRQLLSLSSGLSGGRIGSPISYAGAIQTKTIADPGKLFDYGPNPFQAFGEALKRKLAPSKRSVADYYQAKLLTPLGMKVSSWTNWSAGEPRLPGGAALTAREWIKYGELIRHDGMHGKQRLLQAGLFSQCFQGSKANPNYGIAFWLAVQRSAMPNDCIMAKGAGKQRLYVIPSHRMVILRFGESRSWSDHKFISALMPPVMHYGQAAAGKGGIKPTLTNAGQPPKIGNKLFKIEARKVIGGGLGFLAISAASLDLPLLGGKLSIDPRFALFLPWTANGQPGRPGAGMARINAPLTSTQLLGSQVFLQAGFIDSAAVGSLSLTEGLFLRFYR